MRHPNPIPSVQLNLALPLDVHTRLSADLYSELEQRVPHGAYSKKLSELIRAYYSCTNLDLAPWAGSFPGSWTVSGSPEAIAILKLLLERLP